MRKYGKWLLVLGVLAANPAWVRADGFLQGLRNNAAAKTSTKQENQQLAEEIKSALQQARLNAYDVQIEVQNGVVRLEGKVRDVTHRALATQQCFRVPGVRDVQNNLKFVPGGPIQQTSATTVGDVRQAAWSSAEEADHVQQVHFQKPGKRTEQKSNTQTRVMTQRPVQQQPTKPLDVTQTSGVKVPEPPAIPPAIPLAVEKTVEVPALTPPEISFDTKQKPIATPEPPKQWPTPKAGPSNQQVAENIGQSLAQLGLQGYDIEIRYEDGVALLAGEVGSVEQIQAACAATSRVPHVQNVQNNLRLIAPIAQTSFAPNMGRVAPASMTAMAAPGIAATPVSIGGAGHFSNPHLPSHAWPAYAQYPNSAAIQYPTQYSASAWPYIGPFYPYPQVPLGWREVSLQWDDGFWQLDFEKKHDAWYWLFAPKNWH